MGKGELVEDLERGRGGGVPYGLEDHFWVAEGRLDYGGRSIELLKRKREV